MPVSSVSSVSRSTAWGEALLTERGGAEILGPEGDLFPYGIAPLRDRPGEGELSFGGF